MSYPLNIPHRVGDRPIVMKVTVGHHLTLATDVSPSEEDKTAVTELNCALNFTIEGGLRRTLVQYRIDRPLLLRSRLAMPENP